MVQYINIPMRGMESETFYVKIETPLIAGGKETRVYKSCLGVSALKRCLADMERDFGLDLSEPISKIDNKDYFIHLFTKDGSLYYIAPTTYKTASGWVTGMCVIGDNHDYK
jgi:hypothetical protein